MAVRNRTSGQFKIPYDRDNSLGIYVVVDVDMFGGGFDSARRV